MPKRIGLGQAAELLVHYIRAGYPAGFLSPDSEAELADAVEAFKDAEAKLSVAVVSLEVD